MLKRAFAAACTLVALAATTGCAVNRADATLMADADLSKVKTLYIVHSDASKHPVDMDLKAAFEKRGYVVTTGPAQKPPYAQDAVVTYVDKWMWDLTMYELELTATVRSPVNEFPLATAHSMHTSLTRKSPEEMADEVVANVLAAKH
jgi:hypothetical protein